jgi:hypothetical protein
MRSINIRPAFVVNGVCCWSLKRIAFSGIILCVGVDMSLKGSYKYRNDCIWSKRTPKVSYTANESEGFTSSETLIKNSLLEKWSILSIFVNQLQPYKPNSWKILTFPSGMSADGRHLFQSPPGLNQHTFPLRCDFGSRSSLAGNSFDLCSTSVRLFFDPIESEKCRRTAEQSPEKVRISPGKLLENEC